MLGEDQAPLFVELWLIVSVLIVEQTAEEYIGTLKTKRLRRVEKTLQKTLKKFKLQQ
jgi:hypothetical protein